MRPGRKRIPNELGQPQTLSAAAEQFAPFSERGQSPLLFLGLGPDPAVATHMAQHAGEVWYLEAPQFAQAMDQEWSEAIPGSWRRIPADIPLQELLRELIPALRNGRVLLYRQGPRLFPSFWTPLLGCLRWVFAAGSLSPTPREPQVMLPASEEGLLQRELQQGFVECGWQARRIPDADTTSASLLEELVQDTPELFCSVNFKGLDAYGERFHLLRAAGSEVAVWCVDNPWHLLSRLKAPFWRQVKLFVTDASFIAQLRKAGAQSVFHLPLAAWPQGFSKIASLSDGSALPGMSGLASRLCFVGRSSFPNKSSYFAGMEIPDTLWREALQRLEAGERPHFHWWRSRLELETLWPGTQARRAGLGAEEASLCLRLRCLRHAATLMGLTVFGDAAWPELLAATSKDVSFHPPVDYYGSLPLIYATARYTLNATSLLLPAGLTQRHFDVWMAGGFLLSDATPGLEIFPEELVRPMRVDASFSRGALEARLNKLEAKPRLREELADAWRKELLASHTIRHRAQTILSCCGKAE